MADYRDGRAMQTGWVRFFKNEEYTLCLACLGYHALRTKNMHCVKRVWVSRFKNEEYTLC